MPPPKQRDVPRASFSSDLLAGVFSDRVRFDAARCCSYNGFLGLVLLAGTFVTRFAGPPDPLGTLGFGLVFASALVLIAAFVVPLTRPRLVLALLAAQGVVILALSLGLALGAAAWSVGKLEAHSFKYLPGPIAVGTTYGATLWADFGRPRARPRRLRLAGFVLGVVLEVSIAGLLIAKLLRS